MWIFSPLNIKSLRSLPVAESNVDFQDVRRQRGHDGAAGARQSGV